MNRKTYHSSYILIYLKLQNSNNKSLKSMIFSETKSIVEPVELNELFHPHILTKSVSNHWVPYVKRAHGDTHDIGTFPAILPRTKQNGCRLITSIFVRFITKDLLWFTINLYITSSFEDPATTMNKNMNDVGQFCLINAGLIRAMLVEQVSCTWFKHAVDIQWKMSKPVITWTEEIIRFRQCAEL